MATGGEGAPLEGVWHRLRPGESLQAVARRYRVPVQDIEEINGLDRWEKIEPGLKIFVPEARSPGPAPRLSPTATATATAKPGPEVPVALIWPVPGGKLTSGFGVRGARKHEGIDIAAAEGTAVLAAAGGRVIYSGSGVRGYGNLILIRHTGGIVTVYAHNRRNAVKEGERVQQGQVIAEVGHTGRASGDHLHFEVRRGDTPVDPARLVRDK